MVHLTVPVRKVPNERHGVFSFCRYAGVAVIAIENSLHMCMSRQKIHPDTTHALVPRSV